MTTAVSKASPEITRAAERYLEQYGDPLVMNTYLKVTILCLIVVCLALAAAVFKSQKALASIHPLVIRINDVGHADAIDYRNFQYRPQEAENKYYLTRWAELYFGRNRFTIERDPGRIQPLSTSSTPTCSAPSSIRNGRTIRSSRIATTARFRTSMWTSRTWFSTICGSLRIPRGLSSKRCITRIRRITPSSSGSDGSLASPMSSVKK